jgi:D-3-phosphoglycerate dehydrogenase
MLAAAGIAYAQGQYRTPAETLAFAREADVVLQQSLRPLLTRPVISNWRCGAWCTGYRLRQRGRGRRQRTGMLVCNVPNYCVEDVAEHALALLLASVRRVAAGPLVREGSGTAPAHGRQRGRPDVGLVAFREDRTRWPA